MSEAGSPRAAAAADAGASAGALLRRARQAQGLHIAALAAAIKVTPKKLDALENDRYAELPDATFVRALAQTVCRHLKIDAEPVLALLPAAGQITRLEHVTRGLNTPFRERETPVDGSGDAPWWASPAVLATGALLVVAAAFLWWPAPGQVGETVAGWRDGITSLLGGPASTEVVTETVPAVSTGLEAPPSAVGATPAPDALPTPAVVPVADGPVIAASSPAPAAKPAPSLGGDELPEGTLVLRASADTWVEVKDATGSILLARLLPAGESIGLSGAAPWRVKIGNAEGTEVFLRGQRIEIAPFVRDNVARLELK